MWYASLFCVLRENALCAHDITYVGHYEKSLLRDDDSCNYLRKMKIISSDWIALLRRLLIIYIYSNSKFKVTRKTQPLHASISGLIPKRNCLKFLKLHSAFCMRLLIGKKNLNVCYGRPDYFGLYYSWWNHQIHFKVVHFNIIMQNVELV